jgi:hypothetical protein
LRWNELGKQGVQALLAAVQENSVIQYIELVGNKNADESIRVMETYLQRNRGETAGLSKLLQEGVGGAENEVPFAIL